ncbi:uncharacterized protein EAE98_011029 [Botrytis deweyae]|uniref:Uncharacterized protein n=1 Tax=Botrytis deweyae TaxID=2478750 RepID=A0ABQ7I737_9HELO|nr:uncharacterized protein EAE98_011029 [Botrytis deweyae]KAF7915686.1 hypothetical protein EAE98_011029 [Botrytis deweyae]
MGAKICLRQQTSEEVDAAETLFETRRNVGERRDSFVTAEKQRQKQQQQQQMQDNVDTPRLQATIE